MGHKVLVTRNIPRQGLKQLFQKCEVDYHDSTESIPRDEFLKRIRSIDGLLAVGGKINEELFSHAPRLKVVSNYGVGYDNIDMAAATRRGIIVTNTPDVVTEATAELAFALMLAVVRRVVEADKILRFMKGFRWGPMALISEELSGKTLGIVGFGRIGRSVARRAKAFGMRVVYVRKNPEVSLMSDDNEFTYIPLEQLLRISDIVTIHVPLTKDTYHLIGEEQLSIMKKGAYIINTARGPVIEEEALARALESGHLAGAGLDVYEKEPYIHPKLLQLENTVLTPHIGTSTRETRTEMARLASKNLIDALEGRRPVNIVNPEVYG
jgi:glyoxylate reductase